MGRSFALCVVVVVVLEPGGGWYRYAALFDRLQRGDGVLRFVLASWWYWNAGVGGTDRFPSVIVFKDGTEFCVLCWCRGSTGTRGWVVPVGFPL